MKTNKKIKPVPTNIITGFLGTGKTSAILHLLKSKPDDERWAVLVNEFGEIGVDGSFFWGKHPEEGGVFVREVPGGCMCCASGFPVQIALNQLLARAKPDRLLIEPTGLGHPVEVLELLSADYYRDVLSIQKVITLVDARKLSDSRYTEHATFNQQIATADIIVGNKQDLYSEEDAANLTAYVQKIAPAEPRILLTEQGNIELGLLEGKTQAIANHHAHHHHEHQQGESLADQPLPPGGYVQAVNEGEGFQSVGWRFSAEKVFDRNKLFGFLTGLAVERMKAVFITEEGIFAYNLTADALTEQELDECIESRIEIIADAINNDWQPQLFACLS